MKQYLHFLLFLLFIQLKEAGRVQAQHDTVTRLFRIYEDNDFFNIRGKGTDNAYTNGTRFDLFYTKKKPSRFFLDRAMPKAGDSSVNIYGWGLMQVMFTPIDISKTEYQPDDYRYAGALFATHTLYSYNDVKKYDIQTELLLGVMGPASFAAQTQTFVHRLIHYQKPMGWDNQLKNDLVLNINLTAEKQLAAYGDFLEVIGGGEAFLGTMINGMAVYPLIRIGKMSPYFKGFFSQYATTRSRAAGSRNRSKMQAYLVIKPEAQLMFTNALLEGGLFSPHPPRDNTEKNPGGKPYHDLHKLVYAINYGAVVSLGHFSMSFIESSSTALMKGTYSHDVGNLSLYYSW